MGTRGFSRREFVIATAAGLLSACKVSKPRLPAAGPITAPSELLVRTGGRIVSVNVDDYVLGSVLAEVVPTGETPATVDRIFQVQAILARSYATSHAGRHRAEGFDVCDTVHCQLFDPGRVRTSRFAAAARAAVQNTTRLVLAYSNRPAGTLFHADCGGHTAAADAVWGGPPVPYLLPAPDAIPTAKHREWTKAIAADDLQAIVNDDARTRVGRRLTALDVQARDASGRAARISLGGDTPRVVRGEDLRSVVNQRLGDRAMQSTRFKVHRDGRTYVFEGTGWGHGVGLCQLGAAARARRGESVDQILAAYFRGAALARLRA